MLGSTANRSKGNALKIRSKSIADATCHIRSTRLRRARSRAILLRQGPLLVHSSAHAPPGGGRAVGARRTAGRCAGRGSKARSRMPEQATPKHVAGGAAWCRGQRSTIMRGLPSNAARARYSAPECVERRSRTAHRAAHFFIGPKRQSRDRKTSCGRARRVARSSRAGRRAAARSSGLSPSVRPSVACRQASCRSLARSR